MKFSLKTVLVGGALVGAIALIPFIASAQSQNPSQAGEGRMPRLHQAMRQLNLSDDQKSQLKQIREAARIQIENLLTAEQKQQLQRAIAQGDARPEAMRSLNLTESQRTQRREIFKAARDQAKTVLTAEQQQQVQELIRSRRSEMPQ